MYKRQNGLNNFGGMGLTKEQIQQSIEALGVPVNVRGEALSLEIGRAHV